MPTDQRFAMTILVLRPDHPAADLHDALPESLWEGPAHRRRLCLAAALAPSLQPAPPVEVVGAQGDADPARTPHACHVGVLTAGWGLAPGHRMQSA